MKYATLILLLLAGCSIQRFNAPPGWASAVSSHTRFFGLRATIPTGGTETLGVLLGWGSTTWSVIPVATNQVYAATVSDTFSLGQGLNPFDTTIRENLQTGWQPINVPIPQLRIFNQTNQ